MTVSVTGLVCLKPGAFGHRCYRMRTHIGCPILKVRRAFTSVAAGGGHLSAAADGNSTVG